MTKEKLIAEYKQKISSCDTRIESFSNSIRQARKNEEDQDVIFDIIFERRIEQTQRQAYLQFIKDLEELS